MPITAVSASSSGSPAATSEPKARMRITSVIGSERNSAFLKSLSNAAVSALSALASPNCSMRRSGCASWAAFVAASVAPTRSLATSSSPWSLNVTSAALPSRDSWPPLPFA